MKVGEIVFAPSKTSTMWPGRIVDIGLMVTIKFYRIKQHRKVVASALLPFNEINVCLFKEKNKSKSFSAAIKAAENDHRKHEMQKPEITPDHSNTTPKKHIQQSKIKSQHKPEIKPEAVCKVEQQKIDKPVKDEEDCKAEQNQKSKIQEEKYLPQYDCIASLLLDMVEADLISLSKVKQLREFVFYHPGIEQKIRIISSPQLELERLLEWLLAHLISEADAKTIHLYQKKVLLLLSVIDFTIDSLLNRDVIKLITIVQQLHRKCRLHWNNNKFLQQIGKSKSKMARIVENYLKDYEQLIPIAELVSKFHFNHENMAQDE